MARTRTLTNLILDARQACDQEVVGTNAPLCSDAEVCEYLNQGIAEFQDLLIVNNAGPYFQSKATLTTTSGTDTYTLASFSGTPSVYKILNVFWDAQTGCGLTRMTELEPNWDEFQISGTGWDYLSRVRYEQIQDSIRFVPTPAGAHVVTLKFVANPARLATAAPTGTVDGYGGWERYFICYAAKLMAQKERDNETAAAMAEEMGKMAKRILVMARRNHGEPKRVQDVTTRRFTRYGRVL